MDLWGYLTPAELAELDAGDRHTVELIERNRKYVRDLRAVPARVLLDRVAEVIGCLETPYTDQMDELRAAKMRFADLLLACADDIARIGLLEWCVRWLCENVDDEGSLLVFLVRRTSLDHKRERLSDRLRDPSDPDPPQDIEAPDKEFERLQVQLAGCLMAAEGGTREPVVAYKGGYGWSLAYQRVLELRRRYDAVLEVALEVKGAWDDRSPDKPDDAEWEVVRLTSIVNLLLAPWEDEPVPDPEDQE